jgi:hypothetical protein
LGRIGCTPLGLKRIGRVDPVTMRAVDAAALTGFLALG